MGFQVPGWKKALDWQKLWVPGCQADGGGGILIAISGEDTDILGFLSEAKSIGFDIYNCEITKKGAKNYYKIRVVA